MVLVEFWASFGLFMVLMVVYSGAWVFEAVIEGSNDSKGAVKGGVFDY